MQFRWKFVIITVIYIFPYDLPHHTTNAPVARVPVTNISVKHLLINTEHDIDYVNLLQTTFVLRSNSKHVYLTRE